ALSRRSYRANDTRPIASTARAVSCRQRRLERADAWFPPRGINSRGASLSHEGPFAPTRFAQQSTAAPEPDHDTKWHADTAQCRNSAGTQPANRPSRPHRPALARWTLRDGQPPVAPDG